MYILIINFQYSSKAFTDFIPNFNNYSQNTNGVSNNEINELKNKIVILNNELNDYKKKNIELNNKVNKLEIELKNKNIELENLKKEKSDLYYKNNNLQNENINLNNLILNLNNQINDLKKNKKSNLDYVNPSEKILNIQFKSADEIIDLSVPCKNTDIFVHLEEQLYEHYPVYKETNNIFTCNGLVIKRFKSLEDNKIKNSDKILLNN